MTKSIATAESVRVKVVVASGHAATGCLSMTSERVLRAASRSGFRVTGPIGVQLRVAPDQRPG